MLKTRYLSDTLAGLLCRLVCLALLLSAGAITAQAAAVADRVTAKGIVTDTNDEPLPGVSVVQVGTANAVATNVDGEYSITVPKGSKIEFSYIGKNSHTITVNESKTYNVTLYDNETMLDEVMVTGYATISKAQSTGAYQKILLSAKL